MRTLGALEMSGMSTRYFWEKMASCERQHISPHNGTIGLDVSSLVPGTLYEVRAICKTERRGIETAQYY